VGIFTLLSVSLAIAAPPAVHPVTGEPLVIDCLRGTPDAIDGDLSDWNLEAMTPAVLDAAEQLFSGQATWGSPEDSSGKFYLLWDDQNIYIAAVMKDDKLSMNKTGGDIWNADCIEVFFSTTNAVGGHAEHYQYGFNAKNQKWNWCNMDGTGSREPAYLQIASSETADGYICEASIEYGKMLSLDFSVGNTIGFHPVFDDTDNGDRQLQMTWTGREAHDQSLGFGHMVLSAASALPKGWQSQDIGTTGGSAAESDGTWVISADGADVWGSSDQFHYAYVPLSGDGAIVARVVSNGTGSNTWAKGGVMIRETLDANSKHMIMALTGGDGGGIAFQGRQATGGNSSSYHGDVTAAPPYWVKLRRAGNTITAYSSADGVDWTLFTDTSPDNSGGAMSNPIDVEMAEDVYIGLFVTSHASGEVRTYTFDNVSVIKPVPVHRYTFEDGTANDSVGSAHGTLVGDATVTGGALVLDGDGDWMEMPGEVIAMNTYSEVTIETWFTPVAGGNTGFHMLAAFGEEGTGAADWAGYKYLFITPARGDNVSRAAIQTSSMDDSPWSEETGVSATVEHDDGLEHHFVCTVTATDIAFYIDGALIGSAPLAAGNEIAGIGQAVARLGKGVYPVDPLWKGSINEFNIYNFALSLANVQANYAAGPVKPLVHQYTFEDGTANDSVGSAHGTLIGDAAVVGGALVLDGDGDWMEMPGDVIAMNTYSEVTIEVWFTSVAGGNTGYHMVTAFGEEGTGANPGYGYKYICITPARGNDVSRGMIQTVSMDNDPWSEETGVSDVIEHDDGLPHHMVCTVDDTELAFYIDGVLIGTAALDPPGNSIAGLGTDVARIGKGVYGVDPLWAGSVEELGIYNRALSLAEVQANYAAGPQKVGPAPVDPGTEGLMVHLPLDTASRGVTQDSSDNNRDGTLYGNPTFVEGVVVMALGFDGVDDYVDTGYTEDLAAWTMSAWVMSPAAPSGDAPSGPVHREKNYQFNWNHSNETFRASAALRVGGTWYAAKYEPLEANTWYHLAATYDGEELKAYRDGVLITTNDVPSGPPDAESGTLKLGRHATAAQYFTGTVDEARIYNRALSAEEVLFLAGM